MHAYHASYASCYYDFWYTVATSLSRFFIIHKNVTTKKDLGTELINQPTAIQQTHFQHSERLQELNNFSQTRKEHTNSGSKKTKQFLSIMKGIHQIVE